MNKWLKVLLDGMDVPEQRKSDLGWLRHNLPDRNSNHPDFKQAFKLIMGELREGDSRIALSEDDF